MNDTIQQKEQEEITAKKLTAIQLKNNIERIKKQQEKELQKLEKQYQRELEKQQKQQLRKVRNKKIYDWGGLVTTVFGNDEFDKIADNQEIKNVFIGILLKMKDELSKNGFGLQDGKMTWCESYKNLGRKFMIKGNE
jgi:hypothetical protein